MESLHWENSFSRASFPAQTTIYSVHQGTNPGPLLQLYYASKYIRLHVGTSWVRKYHPVLPGPLYYIRKCILLHLETIGVHWISHSTLKELIPARTGPLYYSVNVCEYIRERERDYPAPVLRHSTLPHADAESEGIHTLSPNPKSPAPAFRRVFSARVVLY